MGYGVLAITAFFGCSGNIFSANNFVSGEVIFTWNEDHGSI